jgi:hypothetical protein
MRTNNETLHNLYFSTYIVGVSKARRMKWAEHIARKVEIRKEWLAYNTLVQKPEGYVHFCVKNSVPCLNCVNYFYNFIIILFYKFIYNYTAM